MVHTTYVFFTYVVDVYLAYVQQLFQSLACKIGQHLNGIDVRTVTDSSTVLAIIFHKYTDKSLHHRRHATSFGRSPCRPPHSRVLKRHGILQLNVARGIFPVDVGGIHPRCLNYSWGPYCVHLGALYDPAWMDLCLSGNGSHSCTEKCRQRHSLVVLKAVLELSSVEHPMSYICRDRGSAFRLHVSLINEAFRPREPQHLFVLHPGHGHVRR